MVKALIFILSTALALAIAIFANKLSKLNAAIEFPIYAVAIGLVVGNVLSFTSKRFRANRDVFRTEFFIKVGLVLLGASINFATIMAIGARGLLQALIGVTLVFFFTWWMAHLFKLDKKLGAVLATGVSICGVSAAIAAAGSVIAKKEHLSYVVAMVILFALPLMVVVPYLAQALHLSPAVTGAWIGNNIDTTAAVTGAAQIAGKQALTVASVVKMSQNVLIGVAAFFLALYFTLREKNTKKVSPVIIWQRFPKFVLGFLLVSILVTAGVLVKPEIATLNALRSWFFAIAFACIGLSFTWDTVRQVGGKPLAVFALATVFNSVTALALSQMIFGGYVVK